MVMSMEFNGIDWNGMCVPALAVHNCKQSNRTEAEQRTNWNLNLSSATASCRRLNNFLSSFSCLSVTANWSDKHCCLISALRLTMMSARQNEMRNDHRQDETKWMQLIDIFEMIFARVGLLRIDDLALPSS